jgi:hypothetical protein
MQLNSDRLLKGKYVLTEEVRPGGMATVVRAVEISNGRAVAIKRMKAKSNDRRQRESLRREIEALQSLKHENIVELIDADTDADGHWFLVLEWIDTNLQEYVTSGGSLSWRHFLDRIGFPVLRAIELAQKRRLVHRDIKPKNILMTRDGIPKIADYGISRIVEEVDSWLPMKGETFSHDRTPGYSPPEPDTHSHSYGRDCFSVAAVAVFCLTGRVIEDDDDLATALQEAPIPATVRPLIERCLSKNPDDRPPLAAAMLAELELIEAENARSHQRAVTIHLELSAALCIRIERLLDLRSRGDIETFVAEEFEEAFGMTVSLDEEADEVPVDLIGATWRFRAVLAGVRRDRLELLEGFEVGAAHAADQRERGFQPTVTISYERPRNQSAAADALRNLISEARTVLRAQEVERVARERQRVFRVWKGFLRDRADLEAKRENAISFVDRRVAGKSVVLTAELAPSRDIVGEERLIRLVDARIIGIVSNVVVDQVTLEVLSGDITRIPRRGELLVNTIAAQRSLNNQHRALDSVIYDRAVNPRLKEIILNPQTCRPPLAVEDASPRDPSLNDEKRLVLQKALGVSELLAIGGPPGTGKTTLIAEIILQWLERNSGSRILLASQTHVALDNVLDRIAELDAKVDVIRIGRTDDPRIAESVRPHMLDRKVEDWITRVRASAEKAMTAWATDRGVDRNTVEIGMKVERLIRLLQQQGEVSAAIAEQEAERTSAEGRLGGGMGTADEAHELEAETLEISDELIALRHKLDRLAANEVELRGELSRCGEYAAELAKSSDRVELTDWQNLFLSDDESVQACKQRLVLLEDWLLRVGRSNDFNAAMLASAQVIAGTCVGVAGVRGMQQVEYDLCIVDEASKATATEILIPMSRSRRWIVVGDPKQLPPFFEEFGEELLKEFEEVEVRQTLLDRMLDPEKGLPPSCRTDLKSQYRMITPIGNLVSHCFYDDQLVSPVASHGLRLDPAIPGPVVWYTTTRRDDRFERRSGKTFENVLEVEIARDVLNKLDFIGNGRKRQISVAVIAGYTGQVKLLRDMIARGTTDWPMLDVVCNTVDAFQGKQADVCVYSVVRSNREHALGFLREKPRLNVALSRGRSGLVIIGDHLFCRDAVGENPFASVITYIEGQSNVCHLEEI